MTKPDTAMILAAGFGTRMGDLTRELPKPLLRVGGITLIDHALGLCKAVGVRRVVVNLHYRGQQIRDHLSGNDDLEVLFSEEQPEILDTGGGLVHARLLLGTGSVFVLNSDALFTGPNPLEQLSAAWDPARMAALMLLVRKESAHAYTRDGDFFLDCNGGAPVRRGQAVTAPYIYTGAQILDLSALDMTPAGAFSLNVIWDRLQSEGALKATVHGGDWVDVGTPSGLQTAEAAMVSSA